MAKDLIHDAVKNAFARCQYRDRGDFEMDKLTTYRNLIKELLTKFVELDNEQSASDVERQYTEFAQPEK